MKLKNQKYFKIRHVLVIFHFLFLYSGKANAQVGVGTISPSASAELDVTSLTKGFLPPRMTTTERNAISSAATGLIIFNTTSNKLEYKSSSEWVVISPLTFPLSLPIGGTGAATLTGYVKGNGTSAMTASASIPLADITGAAPLVSPAFTSIPTAPTATAGTNTTQLATTAFVSTAISASLLPSQTANSGKYLSTNGTSASWMSGFGWNFNGNSNGVYNLIGSNDNFDFVLESAAVERMRINTSGFVGIGTTTPTQRLALGTDGNLLLRTDNDWGGGAIKFYTTATVTNNDDFYMQRGPTGFSTDYLVTHISDVNGKYGVMSSGANVRFFVNGNNGRIGIATTVPDALLSVNGAASKAGGGSWSTFSDVRVKKEVVDFNDGLNTLIQIHPVSFIYNSKSGYTDTTKRYIGVIAQEVEKTAPYMIESIEFMGIKDLKRYDASALNYILVNSVKEMNHKLEVLKLEKNELSVQNRIIDEQNIQLLKQMEKLRKKE